MGREKGGDVHSPPGGLRGVFLYTEWRAFFSFRKGLSRGVLGGGSGKRMGVFSNGHLKLCSAFLREINLEGPLLFTRKGGRWGRSMGERRYLGGAPPYRKKELGGENIIWGTGGGLTATQVLMGKGRVPCPLRGDLGIKSLTQVQVYVQRESSTLSGGRGEKEGVGDELSFYREGGTPPSAIFRLVRLKKKKREHKVKDPLQAQIVQKRVDLSPGGRKSGETGPLEDEGGKEGEKKEKEKFPSAWCSPIYPINEPPQRREGVNTTAKRGKGKKKKGNHYTPHGSLG